ncbi:MAG: diguanylate cyclase [Methyloversatilis sp.]|uniref:sensor domain-containing diguanylate cyclase n=1 Tax=Methyloversatilis sp. TaxID=2569862 RepID=UPI002735C807|nr:diguanylate cyclase [Methyloversatilis sp.]MDP3872265.1 diguanylate cyclase [Methyloversatilis sp.]
MKLPSCLHTDVFQTLEEQIAVIDQMGNIIEVNRAWQNFGIENALPSDYKCVGHNYLETLSSSVAAGDSLASDALQGIASVLAKERKFFYFEYPCHSPNEKRWFIMRITPLHSENRTNSFVISHQNITQRKLAENRVEELAMQDSLTGLANRRAFQLFLNKEMRSSIRNRMPMSLALIDVDYFKNYNDKLGHAAGDQCLTMVGQALLAHARRPSDLAARIGGDEFALILGNTDLNILRKIMKSVLKGIDELKMVFGDSKKVTVSIGYLSVIPQEQQSEDFLFHEADKALYRAKSAGRNQAVHAQLGTNDWAQPNAPRNAAQ